MENLNELTEEQKKDLEKELTTIPKETLIKNILAEEEKYMWKEFHCCEVIQRVRNQIPGDGKYNGWEDNKLIRQLIRDMMDEYKKLHQWRWECYLQLKELGHYPK